MKIKNSMNYKEFNQKGERFYKPSMTVPDQTLSIREILVRYSKGLPIDAGKVPIYHGEEFVPDLTKMDLADIQSLREENEENIKKLKKSMTKTTQISDLNHKLETEITEVKP